MYDDLGVNISNKITNPNGDALSIKDYSAFIRILYNSSYLDKKMSELALEILSQSTFADGLVAGVPGGVEIAHKFGERKYSNTGEKQLHDCGIVYRPQSPYLICVMTRSNSFYNMSQAISKISEIVYFYDPGEGWL